MKAREPHLCRSTTKVWKLFAGDMEQSLSTSCGTCLDGRDLGGGWDVFEVLQVAKGQRTCAGTCHLDG